MKKTIRIKSLDDEGNKVVETIRIPVKDDKGPVLSKKKEEEKTNPKFVKKPKRSREIPEEEEYLYEDLEDDYEDEDL
jgi:hypothetical protein